MKGQWNAIFLNFWNCGFHIWYAKTMSSLRGAKLILLEERPTCSSTSALINLRLFPSGYGASLIFHLPARAVIPSSSCCNNEFALPFFQLFGFLWRLCLACEVSVTLLLWETGFSFDSKTFPVLESNASLQLVCFSNSVQHGNTLCQILWLS